MSLRYELAVLTHGRSVPLAATLARFRENVRPLPYRIRVFADAAADLSAVVGTVRGAFPDVEDPAVSATHPSRRAGFCGATGRLWRLCADDDEVDFVFWLEHDFLVERSVAVEQLASLLEAEETLAQVALVRQACNEQEAAAGGLIGSRRDTFDLRKSRVDADGLSWNVQWLVHRAFFTTNPSLMRREFMAENPFLDDGKPACEGRFGIDLVRQGWTFAYWGDGIPWVRHIGERDGVGY